MDVKEILKHVDHTLLKQTATWEDIKQICDDGIKYGCVSTAQATRSASSAIRQSNTTARASASRRPM